MTLQTYSLDISQALVVKKSKLGELFLDPRKKTSQSSLIQMLMYTFTGTFTHHTAWVLGTLHPCTTWMSVPIYGLTTQRRMCSKWMGARRSPPFLPRSALASQTQTQYTRYALVQTFTCTKLVQTSRCFMGMW